MDMTHFSDQHAAELASWETLLRQHASNATASTKSNGHEFWSFLQASEVKLLNRDTSEDGVGHAEYGPALYVLNHLIPDSLSSLMRSEFGMPASTMTQKQWDDFSVAGFVGDDGSLYAVSKYAVLDPGWFAVLVKYFWYRHLHPSGVHDFVDKKVVIPEARSSVRIAVLGDWGTGEWKDGQQAACPAQLVIEGITSLDPPPDYIVHLGDVYYAGTDSEEKDKLLAMLPEEYKNKILTLNSNHEMYDGANGYFDVALGSELLQLQQGCSYFSVEGEQWILVGLDSAYYDKSSLYMKGALSLVGQQNDQMKFLKEQAAKGKYLILMTHHNGVTYDGTQPNSLLWQQVSDCLDGNAPDLWYWGHIHNGIAYGSDCPATNHTASVCGFIPKMRCCGHASIPFGNASGLHQGSTNRSGISYYAHTPMDASDPTPTQKLRCLNGFALLDISRDQLSEMFFEVSNEEVQPQLVWSEKSSMTL